MPQVRVLCAAMLLAACSPAPNDIPAPYYLLRHAETSIKPLGLAEGVLELRDHCLYLGGLLVVWPPDFRFVEAGSVIVISGDGWQMAPGDRVRTGGGQYDSRNNFPAPMLGNPVPCSGPYLWVGDVTNVERAG